MSNTHVHADDLAAEEFGESHIDRAKAWFKEQNIAAKAIIITTAILAVLVIFVILASVFGGTASKAKPSLDGNTEALATAIANGVKPTNDELALRINNAIGAINGLKKQVDERKPIDTEKLEKSITEKVLKNLPAGVPVSRVEAIEQKQSAAETKLDGALAVLAKLNPVTASYARGSSTIDPALAAPVPAAQAALPVQSQEPAYAPEPETRRQGVISETTGQVRSRKDLFKVSGTPPGFRLTNFNDPAKSAQCLPPRELYRTESCYMESDGVTRTCKLGCK